MLENLTLVFDWLGVRDSNPDTVVRAGPKSVSNFGVFGFVRQNSRVDPTVLGSDGTFAGESFKFHELIDANFPPLQLLDPRFS